MTRYILFASFSQFYKFKLIRQLSQLANEFKFVSCLTSYKAQYVFITTGTNLYKMSVM